MKRAHSSIQLEPNQPAPKDPEPLELPIEKPLAQLTYAQLRAEWEGVWWRSSGMGVERRAAIGLKEDLVEPVAAIGLKEDLAAWHNWPKWPNVPGQVSQLPESDQLPESKTASSKSQLQDSQFPESKTASSQSQLQDSQFPKSNTATSSCNSKKGQPVPSIEDQLQDSQLPESEDSQWQDSQFPESENSQQRDERDVKESHKFLFW